MAHIEIKPDYTKNPKCHFCKKNDAVEGVETTRKCFYFEKVFHLTGVYHKYTYKMVDVLVPSCKECAKKDAKLSGIVLILSLLVFIASVYVMSGVFADTDNVERNWNNVLIACLPSILITILSSVVLNFIIRVVFEPKIGLETFCDDYSPIKKLKSLGFEPRDEAPSPKYSGIKANEPLDAEKMNMTLQNIVSNDDCLIKLKS